MFCDYCGTEKPCACDDPAFAWASRFLKLVRRLEKQDAKPPRWGKLKCPECKFWDRITHLDGHCKRHAPAVVVVRHSTVQHMTKWPQTTVDDWCGEGEAKC